MLLILLMLPSVIIGEGVGSDRRLVAGVGSDTPYMGCSIGGSSGSIPSFSAGPSGIGGGGAGTPSAFSLFMFMIPHTINMKTIEWRMRPSVVGYPVALATQLPNTLRTKMKVSGFAIKKNNNADITDAMNFSCCFRPLQPHPQSLNRPIVPYHEKKIA
jgi:hypothetical protein